MGSHQRLWCEGKTYGEQSVGDEATEVQRGGMAVCGQMEAFPHQARALWRSELCEAPGLCPGCREVLPMSQWPELGLMCLLLKGLNPLGL